MLLDATGNFSARSPGSSFVLAAGCDKRLVWFLATQHRAVDQAQHTLHAVLVKTHFWQRCARKPLNAVAQLRVQRLIAVGHASQTAPEPPGHLGRCAD